MAKLSTDRRSLVILLCRQRMKSVDEKTTLYP